MTSETKRFIELSDIIGLRLQCSACKSSLLLDIEKEDGPINNLMAASSQAFIKCHTCGTIWTPMQERGDAWDTPLKDFLRKMRFLKSLESKLGYAITLEIKDEKKP